MIHVSLPPQQIESGTESWLSGASKNDVNLVKQLIESGFDINVIVNEVS